MEIFNNIPTISEDTLQYAIFLPPELADHASATTLATCIQTHTENILPSDFIWHRDAFEIRMEKKYMLEGRMRVGDCVDDEWCTVWLLKEISSKWDIAISVSDSDGQFLLIEAAEALPRWVKPTNSENRVWIHSSRLHLIDISHVSATSKKPRPRQSFPHGNLSDDEEEAEMEDFLAVEDALRLVRDPHISTFASTTVEQVVWNRIAEYPAAARQHVHATKAYIPLDIAKALSSNPSLIQKAVEAFYTRDGGQLRAAHRMSRFPPHTFVPATVKMTRTAYAQLAGQKFYPPKIFGRWNEREGTREWRWRDVGMKIAVGFEILYQENKGRSSMNTSAAGLRASDEARKDALRRNPEYNTYIQNLLTTDYFKGELQGSQLWNQLEDKAADIFVNTRKQDSAVRPSFTTLINSAISLAPDEFTPSIADEDSDEWLNIDADHFEEMLQGNSHKNRQSDAMNVDGTLAQDAASTQASQLRDLASKVEEFIEGEGDVEGARFADEMFSDEEMDDGDDDSDSDVDQAEDDPEARQAAMDNLVPKLDPSEYGKMPASFHSNSQRIAPSIADNENDSEKVKTSQEGSSKPARQPILPRDTYDGVDSDDETDEENLDEDSESEEDKPQVVGDIEVDMGEEEDEFLEFSRQALGISDSQWKEIIEERKTRGAFVPNIVSPPIELPTVEKPPERSTDGAGGQFANPNLDSFEAVMKAMEAELHRSGSGSANKPPSTTTKDKGKNKEKGKTKAVSFADDDSDEDMDIEAAMDAELKTVLERGEDVDEDGLGDANIDYNLIKNFLESFKSQGGLSGPVGNLAGRLQPGWQLPKDG
ncbi:SGT1 protein-domain-containing protein [Rhodocollybia butyracea]|uniref:SGT1 protein-domain-containing protein n=1 Tax=Rhodocollybia butyracea TaxID=206335 RepID=A0A9P5UD29_9AGAR|nr:SGT1 protein-domain-containing protein [Rhodocollybia butyracea]